MLHKMVPEDLLMHLATRVKNDELRIFGVRVKDDSQNRFRTYSFEIYKPDRKDN